MVRKTVHALHINDPEIRVDSSKSEPIFQLCTLCVRSFRWLGERTYHGGPPRPESARHVLDDWGSSYSLPRLGIFPVGTALADTYRLVQRYRLSVWDASSLLGLDTSDCNYGLDNTRSASAGLPVLRLYFFVCSALQFYFGFKVSRRVCGGRKLAGVLGGIFFLTAPPFVWRGFGHFALASHWLLLAAVDQLLSASEGLSWRRVGWSATLCFIAAAINPYVALMTLLVCSAAHVRSAMLGAGSATRCLAGIAVAFCSVALTWISQTRPTFIL